MNDEVKEGIFKGKTREQLVKIKKYSKLGVVIGLLLAALSYFAHEEAEKQIMILDEGKLDEMVLQ